jgi:hypothetical protein
MTRTERLRKRLHLLETHQGELTAAEKQWVDYIKRELGE